MLRQPVYSSSESEAQKVLHSHANESTNFTSFSLPGAGHLFIKNFIVYTIPISEL